MEGSMKIDRKDHKKDKAKKDRIYRTEFRKTLHDQAYGSERVGSRNVLAKLKNVVVRYQDCELLEKIDGEVSLALVRRGFFDFMW
jgi:hypothetical protein